MTKLLTTFILSTTLFVGGTRASMPGGMSSTQVNFWQYGVNIDCMNCNSTHSGCYKKGPIYEGVQYANYNYQISLGVTQHADLTYHGNTLDYSGGQAMNIPARPCPRQDSGKYDWTPSTCVEKATAVTSLPYEWEGVCSATQSVAADKTACEAVTALDNPIACRAVKTAAYTTWGGEGYPPQLRRAPTSMPPHLKCTPF